MNRVKDNAENIKAINKMIKSEQQGIEETKINAIGAILYVLEDISMSLAEIADKMGGE